MPMTNITKIVFASTVLISGSVLYVVFNGDANYSTDNLSSSINSPVKSESSTANPSSASTHGKYVDYSDSIIEETLGDKILFFHASWCPQCQALEADIRASTLPKNLTIIKVDYDNHQDLRQRYGVTIQTTLVRVDDQGNLVKKFVAYDDPTLQALIEKLL
jgi:thiol-disulfide isomerase/thioredoxin